MVGASDVRNKIGLLRLGKIVAVTILRDGEVLTLNAEISAAKSTTLEGQGPARRLAGMTVGPMTEASPLYGQLEGVLVLKVARPSPARQIGLRKGDVITEINQRATPDMDAFRTALQVDSSKLVIKLRRGASQLFIVVR
ncbi:MAG: PDZ domain-containing protein [Proteobacteria bacterium]|nr:PDZ domain-containing protein [Pseudomonadota bacterium]